MSWAKAAIDGLLRGEQVTLRYEGEGMRGRIEDGAEVTLAPVRAEAVKVGDVVLARVKGEDYLHVVRAIDRGTYLVGDNVGGIGGWIDKEALYGIAVESAV